MKVHEFYRTILDYDSTTNMLIALPPVDFNGHEDYAYKGMIGDHYVGGLRVCGVWRHHWMFSDPIFTLELRYFTESAGYVAHQIERAVSIHKPIGLVNNLDMFVLLNYSTDCRVVKRVEHFNSPHNSGYLVVVAE